MEKLKKTTRKKSAESKTTRRPAEFLPEQNQSILNLAGIYCYSQQPEESEAEPESAETVDVSIEWHFMNEEGLSRGATVHPLIFLDCCQALFLKMINDTIDTPDNPDARAVANNGFLLCSHLKKALERGVFEEILNGAARGAIDAGRKLYRKMNWNE